MINKLEMTVLVNSEKKKKIYQMKSEGVSTENHYLDDIIYFGIRSIASCSQFLFHALYRIRTL